MRSPPTVLVPLVCIAFVLGVLVRDLFGGNGPSPVQLSTIEDQLPSKKIEMSTQANTPPTARSSAPLTTKTPFRQQVISLQHRKCMLALQQDSADPWVSCILRTEGSDNALGWKKDNRCQMKRLLYKDFDSEWAGALRELYATATFEFQGDSTLRELVKLLVSQADIPGTLEKKDANRGLRNPKYFVRAWNASLSSPALPGLPPYLILARLVFRFDFLAISLQEPLLGLPTIPVIANREGQGLVEETHTFFGPSVRNDQTVHSNGRSSPRHFLVLSIASHAAKHWITETRRPPSEAMTDAAIFGLWVGAMEDYLVKRVLGLTAIRSEVRFAENKTILKEESMVGTFLRLEPSEPSTQPPITNALVIGQAFECEAMKASSSSAFRKMAPHCPAIQQIVQAVDSYWRRASLAALRDILSTDDDSDLKVFHRSLSLLHVQSSWRALTPAQLAHLATSVVYMPPLDCHPTVDPFLYQVSKPYCTKDGIHLRTKFLVQKLDAMLNLLVKGNQCNLM